MSLDSLRNGIVYSMQMNHGTIDSSGQNTAGVNNGATPQQVHNGTGAYYFDGINDEITFPIGLQNIFAGTNHYTYSVWLNKNSMTRHTIIDFTSNTSGSWTNGSLWVSLHADGKITISRANGSTWDEGSTSNGVITETNKWYHFVLTYDGSNMKLYINNSLVLTVASTLSATTASAYRGIGIYRGEGFVGYYFNGIMDESMFYNKALSVSEISNLYNKGKGKQYSELTTDEKTGLVSYYGFNGNANDEHGSNNGTVNGATLQQVKLGTGAYIFDGVNDYITTPINYGFTNQQTISVWVKAPSTVSDYAGIIVSRGNNTQLAGINFLQDGQIMYNIRDPTGIESTGVNLKDNQWHLITATYNGTKMVLYVDGVYNNELSKTETIETGDYYKIGCDDAFSNSYFKGIIDDVNIWNRALSSTEVAELYNSGDGLELFPNEADGVVSAWKFDGDATDSALSGNDGTVNGATLITTGQKLGSGAYSFDGSNDFINLGTQNYYPKITISTWIYTDWSGSNWSSIITKGYNQDWDLRRYSNENKITFSIPGYTYNLRTGVLPSNQWIHIVATYDGTNAKIYVNGEEEASKSYSTDLTATNRQVYIGRNNEVAGNTKWWKGLIDDVNIWNRALSSTEISNLYNEGNGLQYDFVIKEISGYLIKRYNGTSWEEYPVKVYNGTDWVDAKVKRYNGSEWVEL